MATTAKQDVVCTIVLNLNRETKNTYRFDDPNEDSNLPSVYVKKGVFGGSAPDSITVTVTK